MRAAARVIGICWMAICAVLWLWLGFAQPLGRVDGGTRSTWLLPSLLSDSQFGLAFAAIVLAGVGFLIWKWGRDDFGK